MQANIEKTTGKSPETAITPSKLNNLAKKAIENQVGSIWLTGEIADLYLAPSGHAYFSLKDHKSSIKCTFFKQYNFKKIVINNGDSILAFGQATLYEERGTFQLKVERVETTGIGEMAKAFAELKIKLEAMGYFSPDKKQKIPTVINSLAIVTSKSSAAITDILNVVKRRNPLLKIKIYHSSVQGDRAVEEIIDALLIADINKHDVILLTRGGGSEEDLWTFNDISIAQTLYNLTTVCVSAIGHERDTSISDLVADISAITPSAAAELLTPDLKNTNLKIVHDHNTIRTLILHKLNSCRQQIDIAYHKLEKSHPKNNIIQENQDILLKFKKLTQSMQNTLQKINAELSIKQNSLKHFDYKFSSKISNINLLYNKISNLMVNRYNKSLSTQQKLSNSLNMLSPLSTLSRGYSITLNKNTQEIIKSSEQIIVGEELETIIASGKIISKVINATKI